RNHNNEDSFEEFSEEELNDEYSEGEELSESEEKQKNISKSKERSSVWNYFEKFVDDDNLT
ncbi:5088_t:CDS:1, partial [Funneliformis geosporum]